jgi:hypothetical protein
MLHIGLIYAHNITAEHYRRHRQQLAEKKTIKKHYTISTKNNMKGIKNGGKNKFLLINNITHIDKLISSKIYKLINKDLLAFLQYYSKEDIITF